MQNHLVSIENCCDEFLKFIESSCYVLPVKPKDSKHQFTLNTIFLETKCEQKDLGIIMESKPDSKPNDYKRCTKPWKEFYVLKRNTSFRITRSAGDFRHA